MWSSARRRKSEGAKCGAIRRSRSGADGEKKEKKEKKEGFYGMKREMRRLNLRVP